MTKSIKELIVSVSHASSISLSNEAINYCYLNILWISHVFVKAPISITPKWLLAPIASTETGIRQ